MNYSFQIILESRKREWWRILDHKYNERPIIVGIGFLFMYTGFILLLLPMIISAWPLSLTLSDTPQIFDFEDNLNSVGSTYGTPMAVASPSASGEKAVECQSGDYILWNFATPSKTIDLTFKTYWTQLPTIANESLAIGQISGSNEGTWQDILSTTLYCDQNGYRGWNLWTGIPTGRTASVSGDFVSAIETNYWHIIRITADLNSGTYRLYMDGTELALITNVEVPANVHIDFFRLGTGAKGDSGFVTYYDDVAVSLLVQTPPPQQWSLRITSSPGGSTNPQGKINMSEGESSTIYAIEAAGYIFNKWVFDGADYSTNSTVTVPAQSIGTQHTLHAKFTSIDSDPNLEFKWLPLQVIGLSMAVTGGCLLWSKKKEGSPNNAI